MTDTACVCRRCGQPLTTENWYASSQTRHDYTCKACIVKRNKQWYHNNLEKARAQKTRANRKKWNPMDKNRRCASFLGVYVAETILSDVFDNVHRMPNNYPGFDFVCGAGYKIDVKSSCKQQDKYWQFHVSKNKIADYFLCIAFDNRDDLTPLHLWLLHGKLVNHLMSAAIYISSIDKWDEFRLDVNKVIPGCNILRNRRS